MSEEQNIPEEYNEQNHSQILNPNSETKNMEVHHHPQLHHNPKPWKEYLLEYLMILLAVITVFFAESLREHIGDNAKEKEYLSSMITELKFDTVEYNNVLKNIFLKTTARFIIFKRAGCQAIQICYFR